MRSMVFLVIGILFIGCTHFEVSNEIHPKITIIGKDVGLVYKLGDLIISDTLRLNKSKCEWISANKESAKWTLYIEYHGAQHSTPKFHYYVNGIVLRRKHVIEGISSNILIANMDNIPGFHLYRINGKKIGEKDKEVIQKEITKVKKEVKANPDKYAPLDSKW